jgi:hypothetical protein
MLAWLPVRNGGTPPKARSRAAARLRRAESSAHISSRSASSRSKRASDTESRRRAQHGELEQGQVVARTEMSPRVQGITSGQAKSMLATVPPRDAAGKTRRLIAAKELAELIAVEAKIKKATAELRAIGPARGSHLMDIAAISQIRLDTDGRAYYRRKRAQGRSPSRPSGASSAESPTRSIANSSKTHTMTSPKRRRGSGRALRGVS